MAESFWYDHSVKRRCLIMLAGPCAVVIGLCVAVFWPQEQDPEYEGNKLSEWVLENAYQPSYPAMRNIEEIGTNAFPHLIRWMQYETPVWRWHLNSLIRKLPRNISRSSAMKSLTTERRDMLALSSLCVFWYMKPELANLALPELERIARDSKSLNIVGRAQFAADAIKKQSQGNRSFE